MGPYQPPRGGRAVPGPTRPLSVWPCRPYRLSRPGRRVTRRHPGAASDHLRTASTWDRGRRVLPARAEKTARGGAGIRCSSCSPRSWPSAFSPPSCCWPPEATTHRARSRGEAARAPAVRRAPPSVSRPSCRAGCPANCRPCRRLSPASCRADCRADCRVIWSRCSRRWRTLWHGDGGPVRPLALPVRPLAPGRTGPGIQGAVRRHPIVVAWRAGAGLIESATARETRLPGIRRGGARTGPVPSHHDAMCPVRPRGPLRPSGGRTPSGGGTRPMTRGASRTGDGPGGTAGRGRARVHQASRGPASPAVTSAAATAVAGPCAALPAGTQRQRAAAPAVVRCRPGGLEFRAASRAARARAGPAPQPSPGCGVGRVGRYVEDGECCRGSSCLRMSGTSRGRTSGTSQGRGAEPPRARARFQDRERRRPRRRRHSCRRTPRSPQGVWWPGSS